MSPARRIANWFRAHENRVLYTALMAGSAAVAFSLFVLWSGHAFSGKVRWTVSLLILGCWLGFAFSARERVVNPLRTLANLLEALHEGDYSIRGRLARPGDALGQVMLQLNAIAATLRAQRLGAVETATLLTKVMEEIDVAVFTFDADERLRLVNRAGERLLAQPRQRLLTRTAASLDLAEFLHLEDTRPVTRAFPGGSGRWGIRRTSFRESGLPHTLLVVSDLTRALREEELQAWQRIVRVLGHELNNSLAPIKSIAGSLAQLLARQPRPADWEDDMHSGLAVIGARSESLSRFLNAYSRLARLPRPSLGPVDLHILVHRTANLETRLAVTVVPGPPLTLLADSDQLEQLLINLIRNAADASLETGGSVTVTWERAPRHALLTVFDDGLGLSNTANLFVPFFTTKPGGSGIGLVLCRQIAEAHFGSLTLSNRQDAGGCQARLALPL
ncbi:MAG: PAS domain-containing sensor histidine kinase [Candidatus Solibacter usitatus]|nr:PAS domain-containing sensor histidine kinase [Candidatus Solibacter usitatus]